MRKPLQKEIDRIARLLHTAFNRHYQRVEQGPSPIKTFAKLDEKYKARYRAAALAMIRDRAKVRT